jgi:hypothetical protein
MTKVVHLRIVPSFHSHRILVKENILFYEVTCEPNKQFRK